MAKDYMSLLEECGAKEYIQCKGNCTALSIIVNGESVYYGTIDGNNLDQLRKMAVGSINMKSTASAVN